MWVVRAQACVAVRALTRACRRTGSPTFLPELADMRSAVPPPLPCMVEAPSPGMAPSAPVQNAKSSKRKRSRGKGRRKKSKRQLQLEREKLEREQAEKKALLEKQRRQRPAEVVLSNEMALVGLERSVAVILLHVGFRHSGRRTMTIFGEATARVIAMFGEALRVKSRQYEGRTGAVSWRGPAPCVCSRALTLAAAARSGARGRR